MDESIATEISTKPMSPLKVLRKQLGLGQRALAFAIPCSPNIIIDTEMFGYRPRLDIQERVAAFFKVDRRVIWPEVQETPVDTNVP